MEFNEKLQELRKQKNLTQEELSKALFVSRTAVSKWESGRGYPNIDSLKAIAGFFGVSVDELLSGDELLTLAQEDTREKEKQICDLVFGLLDCSVAMFFFLPFFGQPVGEIIEEVSLLNLSVVSSYLRIIYILAVAGMVLCGIVILALQNSQLDLWVKNKSRISAFLNAVCTLLFIVSQQPYVATFLFVLLIIKAMLLIKWK